jgi:SPP1 family predicted phage head-tail adaptor
MRAGRLDRRITLQRATIVQDAFGDGIETWGTLATVWASKTPVLDAERMQAGEIRAEQQCRFQIRWSPKVASLNPRDRLVCDGVTFLIWGVKEINTREGLEISATAQA